MKHPTNNPKSGHQHEPAGAHNLPDSSTTNPDSVFRHRWLFRLLALVLVPLLALGGLEAVLRVAGYGYDTSRFEKIRVGRQEFLVDNNMFLRRFFPPNLDRILLPNMMEAKKPPGMYRIFILGESAAAGDPQPAFCAGRYLEVLLRERFPGEKFEIVNLGITAIDSHVIVPIARECARYQGDLWIIYMGNNEMVGPFGAATIFGAQAPPLWVVRLNLTIQQTRVGQLMMAVARKLKGKTPNTSWGGMEMFIGNRVGPDDPRKEAVYQSFQRNLKDILRAGLDSGVKIILNTVAVNLKDSPPFACLPATNLPATDRVTYDQCYAEGCLAGQQGNLEAAAKHFEQAAKLDPKMSDLQFHWAECLLHLTNFAAAREHFQLACDSDALPFRADSRINSLIRQAGQAGDGTNLVLFDAAAAMETNAPTGICGQESFYEHVHLNFDGNYRLACAWAGQLEPLLPSAIRSRATGGWASQETCERRLGLTDTQRDGVCKELIQRFNKPPLSSQSNNARRLEALQSEENELRRRVSPAAMSNACEVYVEAIQHAPDDYWLHAYFGEFLGSCGDVKQALAQSQRVIELVPHSSLGYYEAGLLFVRQKQWAEAEPYFSQAVALYPALADGWFQLGNAHIAENRFELALQDYEQVLKLRPQDADCYVNLGAVLMKLNRRAEAFQRCRQALQLDPNCLGAHIMLGRELFADNKFLEAGREYQEIIRLQPTNPTAHLNLGVTLAKQKQFDGAVKQFEEALRLDPTNHNAQLYRDQAQALMQRSFKPYPGH